MTEELKPCPFCGCTDIMSCDTGAHWVSCPTCGAEGPVVDDREDAVAKWNERQTVVVAQGTTDGDQLCIARAGIALLSNAMREACEFLMETKYGSPARSPGHNARVRLERALELVGGVPAERTPSYELWNHAEALRSLGGWQKEAADALWDETIRLSRQSPAITDEQLAQWATMLDWDTGLTVADEVRQLRALLAHIGCRSPAVSDREAAIEECRQLLLTRALWNKSKDEEAALLRAADAIGELAGRSQPVTADEFRKTSLQFGYPMPPLSNAQPESVTPQDILVEIDDGFRSSTPQEDVYGACVTLLAKFNVTRKTTEEPRG